MMQTPTTRSIDPDTDSEAFQIWSVALSTCLCMQLFPISEAIRRLRCINAD